MWQMAATNRLVRSLFAQNAPAILAMNALACEVRRREESEIAARKSSPESAVSSAVVAAVQDLTERQRKREEEWTAQQKLMFEMLMQQVAQTTATPAPTIPAMPPRPEAVATTLMQQHPTTAASLTSRPLGGVRTKRKPQTQGDVAYYSSHPTLRAAFDYAKEHLYPLERDQKTAWRIRTFEDGREDKGRDRQWRFYRQLAIAVGTHPSSDVEEALDALEARRASFASLTAFNNALVVEQKSLTTAASDEIMHRVFEA